MNLDILDQLRKKEILKLLNQSRNPTDLLLEVLHEFIKQKPDELPAINKYIAVLTNVALVMKDNQYSRVVSSLQNLIEAANLKKYNPENIVINFTSIMLALFPTGEKVNCSIIEAEFYDEFITNLTKVDFAKLTNWAENYGYFDYLNNLREIYGQRDNQ